MEFSTQPPASLPPSANQYLSLAVFKLDPLTGNGHPGHPGRRRSSLGFSDGADERGGEGGGVAGGLKRIISRGGSTGAASGANERRRSSAGAGAGAGAEATDSTGGGGMVGGLRRIASRKQATGQVQDESAIADDAGAPLARTKSRELKSGKWQAKVAVGVTPTHLVFILSPGQTLTAVTKSGPTSPKTTTAHGTDLPTTDANHASGGAGGIGGKIKSLFGRRSSTTEHEQPAHVERDSHLADSSSSSDLRKSFEGSGSGNPNTTHTAATSTTLTDPVNSHHAAHTPAPLQTTTGGAGAADLSYPTHLNGVPVSYVTVPLAAIEPGIKVTEVKNDVVLLITVTSHFSRLVHPLISDLGREADDSWGRSGTIKLHFDGNWIGAKAEAEVLHHHIEQAMTQSTQGTVDA